MRHMDLAQPMPDAHQTPYQAVPVLRKLKGRGNRTGSNPVGSEEQQEVERVPEVWQAIASRDLDRVIRLVAAAMAETAGVNLQDTDLERVRQLLLNSDNYGSKLLRLTGTVTRDIDLEF
jgi:hypothetical protein